MAQNMLAHPEPIVTKLHGKIQKQQNFGYVLLTNCCAAWLSWQRVGLLQGRPEFDSRLGTTGRFSPTELTSDEEMERGFSEWRRINVL
jgi:hypothetical protein